MPILPKRRPVDGWTCREVIDALAVGGSEGRTPGTCEACGTRIRWIHVIEHDEFPKSLHVGCCCAARLCLDYDAEAAERELKNRTGRLTRFVDLRRWRPSRRNPANIWRKVRTPEDGVVRVTVFMKDGRYMIFMAGRKGDEYCHWAKYGSQAEAMTVAFELIESARNE